jgi:hypothetical protein
MLNELVSRVFASRNAAHLQHWASKSYAEHQALGEFYDEVIERLDTLVEAHQGRFGLMGKVEPTTVKGSIVEVLRSDVEWVEEHHTDVCMKVSSIANLIDGVTEVYLTTIYKLENLK